MWIYQGVEQDMRKKTKRIFDDIIIGLKGKDALACLESLEKIQKDFLQDRDSLEGIQKKIDSYPLRYRIIYKGFCNQWSLAELNAALQEKNEEVLYARDLIEASLIYAFQKKLTFDHWYSLIVQIREFESSGSYDGFLINGFNGSYSAFPLARMENYVQMNSCFYAETMYTLQRTLTVEKDLGRLGENQEFVSYMCENIRMFCDGREKSRYYICKYFLFYLNTRIKYYMASDKNRRIKRNIYLDLPLSNISKMDPNRHAHMSEEEIKECLATAKATLWYCLTGKIPDGAYSRLLDDNLKAPSSLGIEIDPELEDILMRGLSLQKEDRPQSIDEMLAIVGREQAVKKAGDGSRVAKRPQKRKKVFFACGVFCLFAILTLLGVFLYRKNTPLEYNAETMYQVTLTPDDKFTVVGYNESIKILEERLKRFAVKSGRYSLTENKGVLTMLLLKEDFPKNTAGGNNYKSTDTDSASVPEYVLKAYLTRAVDLIIQSREKGDTFNENLKLDQTKDFTLTWHKGSVSEVESDSAMTSTQNSNGYYEVIFSKDFLSRNREKIRSWNNNYAIYQDPDDIPSVTPYTTIPMEDGRGCYLTDNDNGAFSDLLKYDLTHPPLEHSFSISIKEQVDWQTDDSSFGEDQVRENKINDGIYCSVYGSMTDGEEMDCYQALRNRLDSLDISYALGKMDALTAVTKGCDAPAYRFLSVKINSADEKLQYWDVWNLIACSHTFCLTDGDGNIGWIFDYTTTVDENGITIAQTELPGSFQDEDKTVYLSYLNGADTIRMMSGKVQGDGSCCFDHFANGAEISDDNRWIIPLIGTCIKNDLPVELLPYDLKLRNETVNDWKSLGLFIEK